MVQKFLQKFFPPGTILRLRNEINAFKQRDGESVTEAWDRFKSMLRKCPNHGYSRPDQICFFYNGLFVEHQKQLDASASGSLLARGANLAYEIIEELAACNYAKQERQMVKQVASSSESESIVQLAAQMTALVQSNTSMMESLPKVIVESLQSVQGGQTESGSVSAAAVEDVNYVHNCGNYNNFRHSDGYHRQGPSQYQNMAYGSSSYAMHPPPGFATKEGVIQELQHQAKPTMGEMLTSFMNRTDKYMQEASTRTGKLEDAVGHITTQMKMLETQIGQIATDRSNQHQRGQFPSNTIVNPREDCKAVTLRSGTAYEGPC